MAAVNIVGVNLIYVQQGQKIDGPAPTRAPLVADCICNLARFKNWKYGGGRGIRTPDPLSRITVFKTAGFNRSPIPPEKS